MTADPRTASVVEQLRRRERWLLALAAVRTELLSGGPVDQAMTLIAGQCASLADADAVLILLGDAGGGHTVAAASGPLAGGLLGAAVEPGEPWSAALTRALHTDPVGATDAARIPPPQHLDMAAAWAQAGPMLLVSIAPSEASGGILLCLRHSGREEFDDDTRPEIVGLAEQGALALEITERAAHRRSSALMADRERIARDLHDHVIQRLFAVGLSLQGQVHKIGDETARERVDSAVEQIDAAIEELRSSIFDLRTVDDPGRKKLRRRLADIVAEMRGSVGDAGPRVSVRVSGPIDTVIGAQLAADAEAVVREALSNAVRHAGAHTITATVTAGEKLEIVVTDDGCGIPEGAARSGLKNLAERALANGGAFQIASDDGTQGTRLCWSVPV